MAVTERVQLDYLGEKFSLTQVGQGLKTNQPLISPLLYVDGQPSRAGQVFVLRTEDLPPASHAECLYLCVGRKPPKACAR